MLVKKLTENIYIFFCPACGIVHSLCLGKDGWQFNGDFDNPTFKPSVLVTNPQGRRCHSYITDGKIQYLADSKHDMAGKTIDMVNF